MMAFKKSEPTRGFPSTQTDDADWLKYRLLLVIALIVLIGGAGFFIWQTNRLQKNQLEAQRLLSTAKGPEDWTAVAEKYPKTSAAADAILNLAYEAAEENKYDQAAAYYQRIVSEFPHYPAAPACELAIAACLEASNKNSEARAGYQKIVNATPPHPFAPPALLGLARLDLKENNSSHARQMLTDLLTAHANSPFEVNARQMLEKINMSSTQK